MFVLTSVCVSLTVRVLIVCFVDIFLSRLYVCMYVLSISMLQYIPCSSAPTILDIMLVKIGSTVDLKRPSTGAARKSEEVTFKGTFVMLRVLSIVDFSCKTQIQ